MIKRSRITWTDYSGADLNFLIGCTPVSEGCANCYARALIQDRQGRDFSRVAFYGDKLFRLGHAKFAENNVPFRRGSRSRPLAFVCDLSDLFHPAVTDNIVKNAFLLFASRKGVDWQILTKRSGRMCEVVNFFARNGLDLSNIWLGITVENQMRAQQRIPHLMRTPAAIRFISVEPMLGPVDLSPWLRPAPYASPTSQPKASYPRPLDWVIVGGESGPRRRPFDPNWARDLRDQCHAAGVPFFFKQGSALMPGQDYQLDGQIHHNFPPADPAP